MCTSYRALPSASVSARTTLPPATLASAAAEALASVSPVRAVSSLRGPPPCGPPAVPASSVVRGRVDADDVEVLVEVDGDRGARGVGHVDLVDGVAVGVGLGADDLAACDLGECRSGGLGQRVAGEGRLVSSLTPGASARGARRRGTRGHGRARARRGLPDGCARQPVTAADEADAQSRDRDPARHQPFRVLHRHSDLCRGAFEQHHDGFSETAVRTIGMCWALGRTGARRAARRSIAGSLVRSGSRRGRYRSSAP